MPITQAAAAANRLIEALPRTDRRHILAACEPVELAFAEVLAEPGERIRHVFFPTTSYISLVTPIDGCASLEVGLVGAVLFHALNGIRIILVDFWSKGTRLQRQMTWTIVAIWLVLMVPGAYFMLIHTVENLFGSTS